MAASALAVFGAAEPFGGAKPCLSDWLAGSSPFVRPADPLPALASQSESHPNSTRCAACCTSAPSIRIEPTPLHCHSSQPQRWQRHPQPDPSWAVRATRLDQQPTASSRMQLLHSQPQISCSPRGAQSRRSRSLRQHCDPSAKGEERAATVAAAATAKVAAATAAATVVARAVVVVAKRPSPPLLPPHRRRRSPSIQPDC